MFQTALAHYQNGRLSEAERACVEGLRAQPKDFDLIDLLGVVFFQTRRPDAALVMLDRAVAIRADVPATHNNRAIVLGELGRLDEALASYDRALALDPDFAEAHNNRGNVLVALGRHDAALAAFGRAVAISPGFAAAHANAGRALNHLERYADAVEAYDRALVLAPGDATALHGRANALRELERIDDALAAYTAALALRPTEAEIYGNRGHALVGQRRYAEALADFERMAALKPSSADAHVNVGHALHLLGRLEAALGAFERAIALDPASAKAYSGRGTVHADRLDLAAAFADYRRATELQPDLIEARWNEAVCRLQSGDFAAGWPMYEWRWRYGARATGDMQPARPRWTGEDITGKRILLRCEQGLGDTIQFCRYAPLVAARGARVMLEAQPSLLPLLSTLAGVDALYPQGEAPGDADLECPLLSLPLAFATRIDTIPTPTAYLAADPVRVSAWSAVLGPKRRPRVGLVWSGNPHHRHDHQRSLALRDLEPLLGLDIERVSLQPTSRAEDTAALAGDERIRRFEGRIADFGDTAALAALMDVVITVDTSVAHLAGAIGRPVWIMLAYNPDWRWLLERSDSPWYRSARLFRQKQPGDWSGVVADIVSQLRPLMER